MENSKKGNKCRHFYIFEISDCRFFVHVHVATDSTEDYSARGPRFDSQQWNIPWMAFMDNHISLLSVSSIPL